MFALRRLQVLPRLHSYRLHHLPKLLSPHHVINRHSYNRYLSTTPDSQSSTPSTGQSNLSTDKKLEAIVQRLFKLEEQINKQTKSTDNEQPKSAKDESTAGTFKTFFIELNDYCRTGASFIMMIFSIGVLIELISWAIDGNPMPLIMMIGLILFMIWLAP